MRQETKAAIEAAEKTGEAVMRSFRTLLEHRFKQDRSLLTKADEEAHEIITAHLLRVFPDYAVISEEGNHQKSQGPTWIIDPIDGTFNFATGVPHFGISIALITGRKLEIGVVYAPAKQLMYVAERGGGAFLNKKSIKVSNVARLSSARVLMDPGRNTETRNIHHKIIERLAPVVAEREWRWCAALDLCAVAGGQKDAYIHRGLHAWDISAAALIIQEAGGKVSGLLGEDKDIFSPGIVATNGRIHKELVACIKQAL